MVQSMTGLFGRVWKRKLTAFFMLCLLVLPASAGIGSRRQQASLRFASAERMREGLNGMPQKDRTRGDYQRVMDAYRSVYYTAPGSSKADASVVAVAELLVECGRAFNDEKYLRNAIGQYEFLRREYPGSKYRFDALFTIGQIYKDDLSQNDKARAAFQEVITRYPHLQLAADARDTLAEMEQQARGPQKPAGSRAGEDKPQENKALSNKAQESPAEAARGTLPLVTGIRHWSTPDYTRVAIDLEQEVKYEAGRVPSPDRIFFDLHDTRLASTLVGKSFDVSDSFLRRVRVAQFQRGMVRVVLEVDAVSDYSAFLLPNPYRLIIDIHGRKPDSPQKQTLMSQSLAAKSAQQQKGSASQHESSPVTAVSPANSPGSSEVARGAKLVRAAGQSAIEFGPHKADGSFFSQHPTPDGTSSGGDAAEQPAKQESTKSEVAYLAGSEVKATEAPTSEPTVQVVAPRETARGAEHAPEQGVERNPERNTERGADRNADRTAEGKLERRADKAESGKKSPREAEFRQAQPTADGQRSLIRALGLKVGRIVIDAGHGGHDTGTIGPGGLLEKDLVLDVALRLGRMLQNKMGAEVIYTRDDDTFVPLETRTAIANQQQADLFISIHANSSPDPQARGVETYYLNFNPSPEALEVAARENALSEKSVHELGDLVKKITLKDKVEESREFAIDVQNSLYQGLAAKDKGIHDRGVKKALFIVLLGANMPSILAEISFISNPGDEHKLQTPEHRQKVAESLYKGIARYINGLSGVKIASKSNPAPGQQ
jgi:N-acetylmuramoyl-L-alanine amidase